MEMLLWTAAFLAGLGFFSYQIYGRFGVLLKLRRDDARNYAKPTWGKRLSNMLYYGVGQAKFFKGEQPAGILHVLVFWGFTVLSLQVITMFARGWFPGFYIPFFGPDSFLGHIYGLMKDIFQTLVVVGVVVLVVRWAVIKPTRLYGFLPAEARLRGQSHWEAYLILSFIATIMISGFFYDAAQMSLLPNAEEAKWQPVSAMFSRLVTPESASVVVTAAWWVHNLVILTFLNLLPRSKHFHIITAMLNVFFGKVEPKGRLPKRDFTVETPLFGRSKITDFTWKQAMDMYSCTECGRCSSMCPATATGKPLAPRQFLLNLRDSLYAAQPQILKTANGAAVEMDLVVGPDKAIIDEVVWSCVQCRACEEYCPVNIEYVDKIVDLRQHLVQEASRFPEEMGRAFKGLETESNPWGISSQERDAWTEGMPIPRIADVPDAEYLYYVGCGGSFDSNNRKSAQSFAKILLKSGVKFGILGKEELCNGETARRLGNEYLFQTMAENLVATINKYNVKKILVNCPHCFNTMANEYPEFGGVWEVTRAADLVQRLAAEGKIPMTGSLDKKVVYHDSCNYGRFNGVYDEPREVLKHVPGAHLEELELSRNKGTCCGAGGGRMWLEEPKDQRVNVMRAEQALAAKPDVIATSCPFCKIMLGSAVNEKGANDKVQVLDVMEIVAGQLPS